MISSVVRNDLMMSNKRPVKKLAGLLYIKVLCIKE